MKIFSRYPKDSENTQFIQLLKFLTSTLYFVLKKFTTN